MAHIDATEKTFEKEVLQSPVKVLVDFWAPWCGPCLNLAPTLEELSDKIKVVKVNIEENQEIANTYGVSSIPTVIIFNKGKPAESIVGFRQKQIYLDALNSK
jgi:thioredoxin 1